MRKVLRWLRDTWVLAPPALRTAALWPWLLGLVLLALGTLGDALTFWGSRPFLTYVASSFTGVPFGIPFALLIRRVPEPGPRRPGEGDRGAQPLAGGRARTT